MDNTKRDSGKVTLVEEGTEFKGSFSSNCPIVVKGRIDGDVSGPSLTVSPTGSVSGTVRVGEIRSEGELAGDFQADVVQLSGRVKDKTVIRAKSLEVKLAPPAGMMQVVFGECVLDVGEMPAKEELSAPDAKPEAPPAEAQAGGEDGPATEPPPAAAPEGSSNGQDHHADASMAEAVAQAAESEAGASKAEGESKKRDTKGPAAQSKAPRAQGDKSTREASDSSGERKQKRDRLNRQSTLPPS